MQMVVDQGKSDTLASPHSSIVDGDFIVLVNIYNR